MNNTNDKKLHNHEKHKIRRSVLRKVLCFIMVFAFTMSTSYLDGLFGLLRLPKIPTIPVVKAEGEALSYTPSSSPEDYSGDAFSFSNDDTGKKSFTDYCYYFNTKSSFAQAHQSDSLSIVFTELAETTGFMGLGNEDYPFVGSVQFIAASGVSNISLPRALFSHVSTDARITDNNSNDITLEITKNSSTSSPLLADYVYPGTNVASWSISVAAGNTNDFAGVIGQMEDNASATLLFNNASAASVSNTASGDDDIKDVGELCGIMKAGSVLTVVDSSTARTAVSSSNGNAGSLVGKMEGDASLILSSYPDFSSVSVSSSNGYAGGLVGELSSDASITGFTTPLTVGGVITGTTGAGGLYGHYINKASEFDIADYSIAATVYAEECGGVFGVLDNNRGESETAASLTILNTGNTGTISIGSGANSTYAETGHFGGIVGKYNTDSLENSLILEDIDITTAANAALDAYGGAVGYVSSAAFVKANGLNITATGTSQRDSVGFFGGLIGKTSSEAGVFIDLGDYTLSNSSEEFKGGGIVGNFANGVLRLSGTTDMSSAKSQKGGQLVGENNNVLVYALGTGTNGSAYESGWTFKRSDGSQVDDLGTWGEVVRVADIEDSTNGILTLDSTNHTVTVKAAQTSMETQTDFAKTALNIQLNQGSDYDCLLFDENSDDRGTLLESTMSLTDNISLVGTGIMGFMRDGSDSIGEFTGTLNGGGKTVTLAIGEKYGKESTGLDVTSATTSEGVGQIYRHPYNGLFAVIGNGTTGTGAVNSLTIDGNINVRNKINGMNIGGIAAVSKGNTTLNGITSSQTISYGEPSAVSGTENEGKNIGGLIGLANGSDNGTIELTGTTTINTNFKISDYFNSWNALGAAIGKVTSPKFTINIAQEASDKLTVSHTMTDLGYTAGSNTDGGGLIGYITSGTYSNRKVNIKNLEFVGCTIVNKATSNGGGFLGYAWRDTDTTIDGLTIKSGTITNTSSNVGVMCYEATGKWTVNDLKVNSMSMTSGAGTSLGMLVNKMYTQNGNAINGALYLDVLNVGYTLTGSGITLPAQIGVFDELAVYSAPNVIDGGAGVISINMNSSRSTGSAKITETGTYQNKLSNASSTGLTSDKYHNSNARYYYNLDKMDTSDDGQNLVLWSVKKYAYTGIASAVPATTMTDSNISGTANLTGLSYYPISKAGNYTLNNLNVTFDYNGIYATAENKFNSPVVSDNYLRDPGATSTNKNQHYLMHGGLFIDLPAGNKITVSGDSSIGGTFLEVDSYKAALISKTMNGNLDINGTLNMKGLIPKTTENVLYNGGYLLINSVSRPDSQTQTISINISGLTASDYGSATLPIAKSLIGAADGRGFKFDFSGIKLDGRKTAVSDSSINTALNNAYGTSKSIFSDATLFYSINTDQNAEMTYNFTYDDDWGTGSGSTAQRNVTYGSEISHTVEYWDTEGNKSRQNKYSGIPKNYTHPAGTNSEYDFSTTVFLPYVSVPYDSTADHSSKYYREIKVNYLIEIESKGCGTYNDPYIIESSDQLNAIAAFIKNGNTISINLSSIILPKYDSTKYNGIAANTKGDRWCTDKDGSGYHVKYTAKTGGGFSANGCDDWSDNNARYYLASAYYKIENDITLDSSFAGFGGTEANYAFRGVIVGDTDEQGAPIYTITNKSQNPFINVSNGCVVKDVNISVNYATGIQFTQTNNGYNNAYFGYDYSSTSTCSFYGGIIGEIMGGDNIIDNSYVKFDSTTVTLKGTSGTIVPVGGYVGVVVFGALIFKNIDASKTTISSTGLNVVYTGHSYNLADESGKESWAAIYVNPLVGRVINGYAVNETGGNAKDSSGATVQQFSVTENGHYHDESNTSRAGVRHTLKNGTKHYSIADIDPSLEKLDVTAVPTSKSADGNINVPNSQALFVLSLITQSASGTATTSTSTTTQSDTTKETSREIDESGNVTIYKTRTIINSGDLSDYTNSLSYGIYSNSVYGMSHNANYNDVGTSSSSSEDYSNLASGDTAACSALPYIIRNYTVGETDTTTTTTVDTETEEASSEGKYETYNGSLDDLDGKEIRIKSGNYYLNATVKNGDNGVKADSEANATKLLVTKIKTGENAGKYTLSFSDDGITKYVGFEGNSRKMRYSIQEKYWSTPYYFNIEKEGTTWRIYGNQTSITQKYVAIRNPNGAGREFCGQNEGDGTDLVLEYYVEPKSFATTTITTINTTTTATSYPARCVTSTAGYYDINLTSETSDYVYQLPDGFRGLGSVGIYDNVADDTAKYGIKLDIFDGNNFKVDQDIYLNKYKTDNYFNVLHPGNTQNFSSDSQNYTGNAGGGTNNNNGIGLFDRIVTKDSSSKISNLILSGSVNTEIYKDTYASTAQEEVFTRDIRAFWLSVGGVCGWSGNGTWVTFDGIALNDLSLRGSDFIGGLLAYSGTSSTSVLVKIVECTATNISLEMAASFKIDDSDEKARNGMGCFVGKVLEGGVQIYGVDGTTETSLNEDLTKFSTVSINSFGFSDSSLEYHTTAGGLVGFAGNGCKIYDMKVMPEKSKTVTIGSAKTRYAGGLVGLMQPKEKGGETCEAVFYNCTVQDINVNGWYAGGFYGGKWINEYSPYSIMVDTCKVIGNTSSNNCITGNSMASYGYAGGFLGCGNVYTNGNPNIEIKDSMVSNYTITSESNSGSVGGFMGYSGSQNNNTTITCYIHDSSIEDCVVGAEGNYAGGAIGKVVPKVSSTADNVASNKMLGYNIKLENVTSNSGNNMGAWIGYLANGKTSIQFTGIGIYGNNFSKNVGMTQSGSAKLTDASFVFADYNGACNGSISEEETDIIYPTEVSTFNSIDNVTMPKYPYVNINPQASMGGEEIISSDGAVLFGQTVTGYTGTGKNTIAAKIYSEMASTGTSQQYYSTFNESNADVVSGTKIDDYMNRSLTDDGDRISTYYLEKGYTSSDDKDYDDFACVVIANNVTDETTALINRYAQLVTNTTTDYAGTDTSDSYFDIVVSSCKLRNGQFVIDSSATPGLSYSSSTGKFSLNSSSADSLSNDDSFTLVDIQFKDPLYTDKVAYHLYIPVYTIKEMEVTFSAAVMNGTNSVSYNVPAGTESVNGYAPKLALETVDTHVDSLDTWYTTYIRYTYTRSDLMALLDSGNLNWNHKKYFYIDKTGHGATSLLPDNTYMVLVDPNANHDKKYQASLNATDFPRENVTSSTGRITFDLEKFTDTEGDSFDVSTFNEMIARKISAVENNENDGKYNLYPGSGTPSNTGNTHYVYTEGSDGTLTYYEYVGSGGAWDLTLPDGYLLNESYYISMYVPTQLLDNPLYGYYIRTPDKFDAPNYDSGTNNAISKSAKVDCYYGENDTTQNRQVYIGSLFDQTTELSVLPNDLEIDTGNRILNIYAKTTIRPKNTDIVTILNSVHADIYHSFNVFLDRKGENGLITNSIYGLHNNGNSIRAWYSVGSDIPKDPDADMSGYNSVGITGIDLQDNYINIGTINGGQTILQSGGVTIYSRIRLEFDSSALAQEFPQKVANDVGVSVRAASNLAYDSSSLAFSSMSAPVEEPIAQKHIYYRQSLDSAGLNYYAKTEPDSYDTDGLPSENYSRLGVSGLYSMNDYMPINSTAQYNVSTIESAAEEAEKLSLTLTLQRKTDTPSTEPYTAAGYQNVSSINEYWGAVQRDGTTHEVVPNASGKPVTVAGKTNVHIKCGNYDEVYEVPADATSIQLEIPKDVPSTSGNPGTDGYIIDENGYIYIYVGFDAKTGDDFIEYANYKVNLSVRLLDGTDKEIGGSYASDYLIYTNAKVNHDFLKHD